MEIKKVKNLILKSKASKSWNVRISRMSQVLNIEAKIFIRWEFWKFWQLYIKRLKVLIYNIFDLDVLELESDKLWILWHLIVLIFALFSFLSISLSNSSFFFKICNNVVNALKNYEKSLRNTWKGKSLFLTVIC